MCATCKARYNIFVLCYLGQLGHSARLLLYDDLRRVSQSGRDRLGIAWDGAGRGNSAGDAENSRGRVRRIQGKTVGQGVGHEAVDGRGGFFGVGVDFLEHFGFLRHRRTDGHVP